MNLVDLTCWTAYAAATIVPFTSAWRQTLPVGRHNRIVWYAGSWLMVWLLVFTTVAIVIGILTAPGLFVVYSNRPTP